MTTDTLVLNQIKLFRFCLLTIRRQCLLLHINFVIKILYLNQCCKIFERKFILVLSSNNAVVSITSKGHYLHLLYCCTSFLVELIYEDHRSFQVMSEDNFNIYSCSNTKEK